MKHIKLFEAVKENYIPTEVLGYIGDILLDMSDNKQPYNIQYFYRNDWHNVTAKHDTTQMNKVLSVIVKFAPNRRILGSDNQEENDKYLKAAKEATEHLLNYIESIGYCYNVHIAKGEVKLNREGNKKADSGSEYNKSLKRFETISELIDYTKSLRGYDVEFCFFELPE